jgi:hypothetical protein
MVFLQFDLTRRKRKRIQGEIVGLQPTGEGAFSGNLKECMSLILQWFRMGALGMAHKLRASYSRAHLRIEIAIELGSRKDPHLGHGWGSGNLRLEEKCLLLPCKAVTARRD